MSISPSMIAATIPALRIASKSIHVALEAGADFASHLGSASKTDAFEASPSQAHAKRTNRLDELLPRLQHFLQSIGVNKPNSIELQTDDQGSIRVDGEPVLKQAVEQWLNKNPEWSKAWQTAAQEFLADSSTSFPTASFRGQETRSSSILRTRIDATSSDHSALTP